jgi:hypothetical protein
LAGLGENVFEARRRRRGRSRNGIDEDEGEKDADYHGHIKPRLRWASTPVGTS